MRAQNKKNIKIENFSNICVLFNFIFQESDKIHIE